MLSIRLTRTGKKNAPHYRIVVQEKRSKLNGGAVDTIGHYHPADKNKLVVIDKEKAEKWLKVGAQPSDTVTNLMVKEGILTADRKIHHFFTPVKKEEVAAVEEAPVAVVEEAATEEVAAEEAPAAEETEAPAEETAAEEAPEATA